MLQRDTVDVAFGDKARANLVGAIDHLAKLMESETSISRMPDGSYLSSYDSSMALRWLRTALGDHIIRDLVQDACNRAESLGPCSGPILVRFAHNLLQSMTRRLESESCSIIDHSVSTTIDELISRLPEISDQLDAKALSDIIRFTTGDDMTSALVVEASLLAGTDCRIFIERAAGAISTIERTSGHTFNLSPNPLFYKQNRWSFNDVSVFVVDGTILSVSEIDALLQACHKQNKPLAIFARGFRDDVISTMQANWLRGTLKVIPIEVSFDLESVNVLNDIAVCVGGDVVSSLKGELISTAKIDALPVARKVTCKGSTVTIDGMANNASISRHVVNLRRKRDAETLTDVRDIIDRRIKSLSSTSVTIRVASPTASSTNLLVQKIDFGLRTISSTLSHGTIRSNSLDHLIRQDHDRTVITALEQLGEWRLPLLTIAAVLRYGSVLARSILSTGAVVSITS